MLTFELNSNPLFKENPDKTLNEIGKKVWNKKSFSGGTFSAAKL